MSKVLRSFAFTAEAREDDSGRGHSVDGYASVFNSTTNIAGLFSERIDPHAFDQCDLSDVCFLVNHDTSRIALARSRNNSPSSTLRLSVDSRGLHSIASLDTENNMDARALYSAVQRGDIAGMSMMFIVEDDKWEGLDSDMPTRTITKISKVYEVSAVNFPAYSATEIYARSSDSLESDKTALESARRKLLESSDNDLEIVRLRTKFHIHQNQ